MIGSSPKPRINLAVADSVPVARYTGEDGMTEVYKCKRGFYLINAKFDKYCYNGHELIKNLRAWGYTHVWGWKMTDFATR